MTELSTIRAALADAPWTAASHHHLHSNAPAWLAELVERLEDAEAATEWDEGVDALRYEVLSEELGHYMRENVRMYNALQAIADSTDDPALREMAAKALEVQA